MRDALGHRQLAVTALACIARIVRRRDARHATAAETGARGAVGFPLVAAINEIVDAGEIDELFELQLRRVAQRLADFEQLRRFDFVRDLMRQRSGAAHAATKGCVDLRRQCFNLCGQDLFPGLASDACSCARSSSAAG